MTDVTVANRRADSSANEDLTKLARHGADTFGYKANLRIDRKLAQLLRLRGVSSSTSKGRHSAGPSSSSTYPPARRARASPEPGSRSAPRSTGTSGADALAAAPAPWQTLRVNPGSDRRTGSLGRVR